MTVCERCLEAIESHEGKQWKKEVEFDDECVVCGFYDDDGNFVKDEYGDEEAVFCEWCEEYHPYNTMYII